MRQTTRGTLMPEAEALRPGDPSQIGPFRLTGRLGEGGQGVVFMALSETGERVAVKLLHTRFTGNPRARGAFAYELAAAQKVDPFCTARILAADVEGDIPYIASEYIEGHSLKRTVEQWGPRAGSQLNRLAIGTATALVAIHKAGVVHRDFKPSNVLLGPDGPRVIDFGVARALDLTTTSISSGGPVGTPAYMAPEQFAHAPVNTAVDVFAWASTLVYASCGQPPFGNDSISVVINRILNAEPDLGALTGGLRELAFACLQKNPQARPSADQLLLDLIGSGVAADGSPPRPVGRAVLPPR
ncbi:serine/threonine-protein kinase, partial [Actinocorallia lasiicapitis]